MTNYIPLSPEYTHAAELVTYQDAVERVLAHWDRHNAGRDAYFARSAVSEALRKLGQYRWKWYRSTLILKTEAEYETGTIEYDHTGGTYERELTLSDGTWPTNAALGQVVISQVAYPIETRVSDTVVQLRADANPGTDLAASTTYAWFHNQYRIPPDIIETGEPKDMDRRTGRADLTQMHPDRGLSIDAIYSFDPVEYPWAYSIERDRRSAGKIIRIAPPPSTARSYSMSCRWMPRQLVVEKYQDGTLTTTDGSTAVTGTNTTWTSAHVGCVVRVSANSRVPTSVYGARLNDTKLDMEHNPASVTRIVKSVTDTTHLVLDADPEVSLTSKAYVISDPIDIDWNVCGIYWDRMCEYFFARNQMGMDGDMLVAYARQVQHAFDESSDMDRLMESAPNGLTLHPSIYDPGFEYYGVGYWDYGARW